MAPQELALQQKRELEKRDETTHAARTYIATADVYETEAALTVVLEMPGVDKNNMDISVEDDVLTVRGSLDFSKYEGMQPLYTEYNIGHYQRRFALSSKVDQSGIKAELKDGVLTLTLPKAEAAKPRRIAIG